MGRGLWCGGAVATTVQNVVNNGFLPTSVKFGRPPRRPYSASQGGSAPNASAARKSPSSSSAPTGMPSRP